MVTTMTLSYAHYSKKAVEKSTRKRKRPRKRKASAPAPATGKERSGRKRRKAISKEIISDVSDSSDADDAGQLHIVGDDG